MDAIGNGGPACRIVRCALLVLLLFRVASTPLSAQEYENVELHGFFLGNYTGRTTGVRPPGEESGDFLLVEERVRMDLSAWSESIEASVRVKGDFFHDAVADEFDIDLREAYVDYTKGDFDFRLGRQIATWGVGDLLFINDVFPKDWVSFFTGRPLEYLKVGVDALRTRYSSEALNAELLVIPVLQPDIVPTSERFFLFDPFASISDRDERRPDRTYANTELALRLYRRIRDFDVSAYVYRGFWHTPSMRPDNFAAPTRVIAFYPDLSVYGASMQGSAFDGILSFEFGYYRSRNDEDGDDPTVPNSQWRILVGYQRQLWEDFTLGIQYYSKIMEDHGAYRESLPAGFPVQHGYRDTITLRAEQLLEHQTWKLALFYFYSPSDSDHLIQPYVSYKFSDELAATLGANIFGGTRDWTSLGQFDKNDNVYLSVRYGF
jgi:hypothetical protein